MDFGDYIVYADESGDHSLVSIDPDYPVFVLRFCVFRIDEYVSSVVPRMQALKFRFFGHDAIVLHSHDIRKSTGPFKILFDRDRRNNFLAAVTEAMEHSPCFLVVTVIDKRHLRDPDAQAEGPYALALKSCLERTYAALSAMGQENRLTHIVAECRGRQEDRDLELVFRRAVQATPGGSVLPFDLVFAHKGMNSTGLQFADLIAHPIGRHHLRPPQPNQAFEVIAKKLRNGPPGSGIKVSTLKNRRAPVFTEALRRPGTPSPKLTIAQSRS